MQASAVHGSSKYARSASLQLAQPAQAAQAARTELMDGAALQQARPAYKEAMDNKQLMNYAVDTHKETTESARRALKTIESAKQVQAATLDNLRDQGQQMERIERDLDQLGSELTYSQRVLRAMRVCCCVDICCPGMADPKRDAAADARWREDQQSRKQQSGARSNGMQAPGQQAMAVPAAGQAAAAQGGQAGMFVGPNTQGLSEIGFADEAQVIQGETVKQDAYLDQISEGLEHLKAGAYTMRDEMSRQERAVNELTSDAHRLDARLSNVNKEGFRNL